MFRQNFLVGAISSIIFIRLFSKWFQQDWTSSKSVCQFIWLSLSFKCHTNFIPPGNGVSLGTFYAKIHNTNISICWKLQFLRQKTGYIGKIFSLCQNSIKTNFTWRVKALFKNFFLTLWDAQKTWLWRGRTSQSRKWSKKMERLSMEQKMFYNSKSSKLFNNWSFSLDVRSEGFFLGTF